MMTEHASLFEQWCGIAPGVLASAQWEMVPLEIGGDTAGVAAVSGTEIHFALSPSFRGRAITRARARAFLAPLMDRFGFLTTRAVSPTPTQDRFLAGLGFERTRTDGDIHHYMLAALPFGREN